MCVIIVVITFFMDRRYNENAGLQRKAVERMIENISFYSRSLDDRAEYIVADYGCGPGANAVQPIRSFLENKPNARLLALMVDQQADDFLWKQLSSIILEANLDAVEHSIFQQSFFEPVPTVFGKQSLDMGWSSMSLHWTSRIWCELENDFWPSHLPTNSPQRAIWAKGAEQDWKAFLHCRAGELRAGGLLVITMVGSDGMGDAPSRATMRVLAEVKQELLAEGAATSAECARLVPAFYERSTAELLQPLLVESELSAGAHHLDSYIYNLITMPTSLKAVLFAIVSSPYTHCC